jgi:hypothetical protein
MSTSFHTDRASGDIAYTPVDAGLESGMSSSIATKATKPTSSRSAVELQSLTSASSDPQTAKKVQEKASLLALDAPQSDTAELTQVVSHIPTEQVAAATPKGATVLTKGYKIVACAATVALLAQVLINRFAGSNSIQESEGHSGVAFLTTMLLSHFSNK